MLDDKIKGSYSRAMNKLDQKARAQFLHLLCEGSSIRAVTRLTGASKNTVIKLMVEAGQACADYHDKHVRNVKARRIQCDEIWSFCYAKQKNVRGAKTAPDGAGDVWTWTAIDAESKLMVSWWIGSRDSSTGSEFLHDLKSRLANRVQLTTDGHGAYLEAVDHTFGDDIDYAMLIKLYGNPEGQRGTAERKYSPSPCIGTHTKQISGDPDPTHVSTSFAERQNLNMRMHMRRFTRLTNAFSKKFENHAHAVSLFSTYYNFVRIHKTLRVTPAMAAGVTGKLWEIGDIVSVLEAWEFDRTQLANSPERISVR
jgi:IS1 family transposase